MLRYGQAGTKKADLAKWIGLFKGDLDRVRLGFLDVVVLVVLQAEVGDLLLAHQPAQGVLELRLLDEEVVLRVDGSARAAGS